jgi:hypothetical protein
MTVGKQRHGCLTVFLFGMIAMEVVYGFINASSNSGWSSWGELLFLIAWIMNLVFIIALFGWKKWGFWGICFVAVAKVLLGLMNGSGFFAIFALTPAIVAYGVLQIGKDKKGWTQLE